MREREESDKWRGEDGFQSRNRVFDPLTDVRGLDRERRWIPAYAGMTGGRGEEKWRNYEVRITNYEEEEKPGFLLSQE